MIFGDKHIKEHSGLLGRGKHIALAEEKQADLDDALLIGFLLGAVELPPLRAAAVQLEELQVIGRRGAKAAGHIADTTLRCALQLVGDQDAAALNPVHADALRFGRRAAVVDQVQGELHLAARRHRDHIGGFADFEQGVAHQVYAVDIVDVGLAAVAQRFALQVVQDVFAVLGCRGHIDAQQ